MMQFNYSVFDIFRTSACSASGRFVHAVYGISCWNYNKRPYELLFKQLYNITITI